MKDFKDKNASYVPTNDADLHKTSDKHVKPSVHHAAEHEKAGKSHETWKAGKPSTEKKCNKCD